MIIVIIGGTCCMDVQAIMAGLEQKERPLVFAISSREEKRLPSNPFTDPHLLKAVLKAEQEDRMSGSIFEKKRNKKKSRFTEFSKKGKKQTRASNVREQALRRRHSRGR